MYHPQQSSSSSFTPYFPSASNPSPYLSFPQPLLPSSEPPLHPPGTDPYANSVLFQPTHVGFEAPTQTQTQYFADPNAASHNWVVTQPQPQPQPQPDGFAINSLHENQLASTSSNSLWNGQWPTQSLGHNVTRKKQAQIKFIQPLRCEVCKVDCNSKDVFDKHVLGKKHKKNLEVQKSSLIVPTSFESNVNMLHQVRDISGQVLLGTSHVATSEDVETKKRKLLDCGTSIDSVRVCTVCNVTCNSQEVFNTHLSGKRHAAQVGLISKNPLVAAIRSHYDGNLKKKPKKNKAVVQSAWCEVCKINCNSTEIYATHLVGKKHLKKLEKAKSDASASNALLPSATDPIIGPVENPDANKTKSNDDTQKTPKKSAQGQGNLETKKRKLMESGMGAGSARTCTICNVVCNSQMVYDSHLAGQKHAAMLKKQADSGMTMLAPPLTT